MKNLIKITVCFLMLGIFVFTNNVSITEAFGGSGFFDGGAAFGSSFFSGSVNWDNFNSETPVNNVSNVGNTSANNVSNVGNTSVSNVSNVGSNFSQNVTNVDSTATENINNVSSNIAEINQTPSTPGGTFIHQTPVPPPVVKEPACSMNLNASSIFKGETVVLSWTSDNVNSVIIDNSIGKVALNGSLEITPNSSTTYIGTFKGERKTINCQATLEVKINKPKPPLPKELACTMSISPSSVVQGESAVLIWNSVNAERVSFDNLSGSFGVSGSVTISPDNTTTYTGIFKADDKIVICHSTLKIKLIPPKVCTVNCGGGGVNPPNVYLSYVTGGLKKPEPSFIYLSQIPYTGPPLETVKILMFFLRSFFFGGLLFAFYKIK